MIKKKQIILRKTESLSSSNKYIPPTILAILTKKMKLADFVENSDYTAFNSHIPRIKMLLSQYPEEEQVDFFKFAICLGCFSKKKILDTNLKKTEVLISQKASALLAKLMKNPELQLGSYHGLFNSLGLEKTASQEFLKFITPQGKKKDNLELLLKLEREECPGIFAKVMSNFDDAKKYRTTLAEDGTNKTISWKEALTKFY
ncbi:MAG: hypothetical protein IJH39_08530 [Clostridia bacterium]|nr:hypothetical protein [Clostridia bacterium]